MGNAYCTLEDVKSSLSGDVPNMGTSFDASLVSKILQVSRDIDRKVAQSRGDSDEHFSFLADQIYGRQIVYLSATPAPSSGTFVLAFDGEISNPIVFDATGADVQIALDLMTTLGTGNTVVSGFAGGPWTVDFAGSLTGPRPSLTGAASVEPADASVVVLPTIQGVQIVHSERIFRSEPALYGNLLVIDDCVDISEVRTYVSGSLSSSVIVNVDYVPFPLRGLPTYALKRITPAGWPEWPYSFGVVARWGYRTSVPEDVREATIIEVVRSHFSSLASNDDRLGMTPFGSVMTSKAWTSKFWDLIHEYGNKLW